MAVKVVRRQRLLDPGEIEVCEAAGAPDRLVERKTLVGVRHDLVAGSEGRAHGGKPPIVLGDMRTADLDLRAGESLLAGGERVLDEGALVDMQPATFGCIERAAVCGATGNDPERQLPPLGAQVPERGVERPQRKRPDRTDSGRMGRKLEFAPDRLDPLSLLAD